MNRAVVWAGAVQVEGMAGGKVVRLEYCLVCSRSSQIHVAREESIPILCSA